MRALTTLVAITAAYAPPAQARQSASAAEVVIDTIVIVTGNVFTDDEARSNAGFRFSNAIHFTTRPGVVRRELLFEAGEVYDSAVVAETERNLRRLGIFRDVLIDSVRVEGRLVLVVQTFDSWSTQLTLNGRTTGNTFTWVVGVSERNFLGTGNPVSVSYRKDPDRNAFTAATRINRLLNSNITTSGYYENLSDGRRGGWLAGFPFRSFSDRKALEVSGERGDHRVLQFRTPLETQNVVEFQRRSFLNRIAGAYAPIAETGRYLRVGTWVQVKREEILLQSDRALAIPDTVTGAVGVFAEYRRANFKVVTHFNGFALREDLDLSTVLFASTWVAPSAFGYERTGLGPAILASTGIVVMVVAFRVAGRS